MRTILASLGAAALIALGMGLSATPASAGVCDGWYAPYHNCPSGGGSTAVEYAVMLN